MSSLPTLSVVGSDEPIELTRQVSAIEVARHAFLDEGELTVSANTNAIAALCRESRSEFEVPSDIPLPLPPFQARSTLPPIAALLPAVRSSAPASDPLLPCAMPLVGHDPSPSRITPVPYSTIRPSSLPPPRPTLRNHVLPQRSRLREEKIVRGVVVGIWSVAVALMGTLYLLAT